MKLPQETDDRTFDVKLDLPKAMGGHDGGTDPQLFTVGCTACVIGAMRFIAGTKSWLCRKIPQSAAALVSDRALMEQRGSVSM